MLYCEHPFIIDNGSFSCKVGFVGDKFPSVLKSIVGRPNTNENYNIDYFRSMENGGRRGITTLKYPIIDGEIINWDDMELLWSSIFNKLQVNTNEQPIILTESKIDTPKEQREKMTEIMFEKFHFPAVYIANQAIFSLFASSKLTGFVLESGLLSSTAIPIYNGKILKKQIQSTPKGGMKIVDQMINLFREKGYFFTTTYEREIVRDFTEKLAFFALDFDKQKRFPNHFTNYELPDGQIIEIGIEKFSCTEILFNSSENSPAIHKILSNSILKCDESYRDVFYRNIILSGGGIMYPGICERLKKELQILTPSEVIEIEDSSNRIFSSWKGASMFGSLANIDKYLSIDEYNEKGPSIIHSKASKLINLYQGKSARK